ncbi:MAG: phospholipase D family protein [Deltaproteobacteria bacterium]|nr:phospholipase D family protein [Deltaproteobacteria bacterium]
MLYNCHVQTNTSFEESIKSFLSDYVDKRPYGHLYAAMAYVTVAGVRDVLSLFEKPPDQSRWVIGLDDAMSQPGAIELCKSFSQSQVRVASFEGEQRRFHPKVLYFSNGNNSPIAFMMLGSANLTKSALSKNIESVIILQSETDQDKIELDQIWNTTWDLGRRIADPELEEYKQKYTISKKHRNFSYKARTGKTKKRGNVCLVLEDDRAEIDPTAASTCWIECGNVTAMGRELEFKAEQGLFFGLNPHGEDPKYFKYKVSDGSIIPLRMKYQGNHMWRLQMTNNVPEVADGLRPLRADGTLGRSPWVAIFKRIDKNNNYTLGFVRLNGKEHKKLRQQSIVNGTYGKTTAREYGWF